MQSRPPSTNDLDGMDGEHTGNDFGYVNYKTLLLFHPRMKVYNFKINNFSHKRFQNCLENQRANFKRSRCYSNFKKND